MNTPNRKPVSLETRRKMSDRKRAMWATPGFKDWYFTHARPRKYHVKSGQYWYVRCPQNPGATKQGYMTEQRFTMEQHLGRLLRHNEIVHHINHDKYDNRLENLQVVSHSQHAKLHHRQPPSTRKLTSRQVHAILRLIQKGARQHWIAGRYGVKIDAINRLANGHTYQNVTQGHLQRGYRRNVAKLSDEQVTAIRKAYATGTMSQSTLAKQYHVIQQTIQLIVSGKRWTHLPGPILQRGRRWRPLPTPH